MNEIVINHSIIGCGRIASNHITASQQNNFNVILCCDKDINKAKSFAKEHNIAQFTDDYHNILIDKSIDSVSICTDHYSHTRIARDFINEKHLIIEKPLSDNFSDALNFSKLIAGTQKIISVISQHRFDETVRLIKKLLEIKAFGSITLVNIRLKCSKDISYYEDSYWRGHTKFEGGSTVINQSFHLLDILTYFFGIPKEVKTYLKNYKFPNIINTEDTCSAIMDFDNFICSFSSTNSSVLEWSTSFEIIGTKGEVEFTLNFPESIVDISISPDLHENFKQQIEDIDRVFRSSNKANVNYFGLSHIKQFENFKNAIFGLQDNFVSIENVLQTQNLIDKIYHNEKK